MLPVFLLMVCSLACLLLSLAVIRTQWSDFDSPFLQKENWAAYAVLALIFAGAALNSFLRFQRRYELDQNQRFSLNYFGWDIALNHPILLIYAALAFGMACGLVGSRRTRKFHGASGEKRIAAEVVVLLVITGLVTFGCFVWPTPWVYSSWSNTIYDADKGIDLGAAASYRQNRLSGRLEAEFHGQWYPVVCLIDTCVLDDGKR